MTRRIVTSCGIQVKQINLHFIIVMQRINKMFIIQSKSFSNIQDCKDAKN